jgi:hypothetical protein
VSRIASELELEPNRTLYIIDQHTTKLNLSSHYFSIATTATTNKHHHRVHYTFASSIITIDTLSTQYTH